MSPVIPATVPLSIETLRPAGPQRDSLDADRVARWLVHHPDFFDQHADLLADVRLRHAGRGKAVSLIERQVDVLRARNQTLAERLEELIRIAEENDGLNARLQQMNRDLLAVTDPVTLPAVLEAGLKRLFGLQQVAVRCWDASAGAAAASAASADLRQAADAMAAPYCGPSVFPEAAGWLPGGGADTASVALFALRTAAQAPAFGLVVLGSPDAGRFDAGMGTRFLEQMAELASASLSRLNAAPAGR